VAQIVRHVIWCGRCAGSHDDIVFKELSTPIADIATHFALCPVNGEPILLNEARRVEGVLIWAPSS
jgi:hypothetical protein